MKNARSFATWTVEKVQIMKVSLMYLKKSITTPEDISNSNFHVNNNNENKEIVSKKNTDENGHRKRFQG